MISQTNNNMLSLLESLRQPSEEEVTRKMADDFRKRRIEKNITQAEMARLSQVPLPNITRFEQKGKISLGNLVRIASALGYVADIQNLFAQPKYNTIEEATQIRKSQGRKRASHLPSSPRSSISKNPTRSQQ